MFGYQNHGFSPYEEDWPPWSWSLYNRYPVYTRPTHYSPPWLPRGSVQVYGHHPHHTPHHHHPHHHHAGHYLEPEFRSNSANLPLSPPVEYVWASRPARRTKSSAQHRQRQRPHYFLPPPPVPPHTPPAPLHCYPDQQPLSAHTSFARRFFNDRDSKTDLKQPSSHGQRGSQRQQRILIEPDVHDHQPSLISQVLVSRPTSQTSQTSQLSERSRERPSSSSSSYRVLGNLLPHTTLNIHRALLDTPGLQHLHQPGDKSCTCYQCQANTKQQQTRQREKKGRNALNSLSSDINSNFIVQGKNGWEDTKGRPLLQS